MTYMSLHSHGVKPLHRHKAVSTHVLVRRAGVPYEVERRVCKDCERVLSERPVRRAAA
jgi:hypothetical protein